MPETPVLLAASFAQKAEFAPLNVIDRHLSAIRYRRINGVRNKDDRQACRALEKLRAAFAYQGSKEASQ